MSRINRCIDLFESGQPVMNLVVPELSYEAGWDPVHQSTEMILAT